MMYVWLLFETADTVSLL